MTAVSGRQVSIPGAVKQALARVGAVSIGRGTVDISNGVAMTALRFPCQEEHAIIRVGLDPVAANGRHAGVVRHVAPRLDDGNTLWVSAPQVLPWGEREPSESLTAEVLRYRADALMWHGLSEYLVDGIAERDLGILVEVDLGPVTMPVPVSLYPSPQNASPSWVAVAWFGPDTSLRLEGSGLCSMTVLQAALAARLSEETFVEHQPTSTRCASSLDGHERCGVGWNNETPWAARVVSLLLGLCRDCAVDVLESQVEPLPIQPPRWGEKIR